MLASTQNNIVWLAFKKRQTKQYFCLWMLVAVIGLGVFSTGIYAENTDAKNTSNTVQNNAGQVYIEPQAIPDNLPKDSIVWPLLPQESIAQLSRLFYPNNAAMQARFVQATLALNQQAFTQNSVPQQVVLIVIPDIKALSAGSNATSFKRLYKQPKNLRADRPWLNPLQLSYALKDAAAFIVNPKLIAAYDDLVKRNAYLKEELNKLNLKLASLQQLMETLKVRALALFSAPNAAPVAAGTAQSVSQPSSTPSSKVVKPNTLSEEAAPQKSTPKQLKQLPPIQNQNQSAFNPAIYVFLALLALAGLVAFMVYRKKAIKWRSNEVEELFNPLATGSFKGVKDLGKQEAQELQSLDFSLTATDSGSMALDIEPFTFKEQSESILEQARIYVSFDRADEAIALLKAQIKTMPKASLHHWLYLLDIYRDNHLEEDFLRDAKELHATFNVVIPEWQTPPASAAASSTLEDFPHIITKLTETWRNDAAASIAYLEELLTDNRDQERIGFGMPVFLEILCLVNILTVREKMASSK